MVSVDFDTTDQENRGAVYALLARLWIRELDGETIDALKSNDANSVLADLGLEFDHLNSDELAVDFCRLFIGPRGAVLPIQSVHMGGLLNGAAVDSMRDHLQYVQVPHHENQILDHLGFQLQVMSAILQASNVDEPPLAENTGENAAANSAVRRLVREDLASSFFAHHLAWTTVLFEPLEKIASGFYASLIGLTRDFLRQEALHFGQILDSPR